MSVRLKCVIQEKAEQQYSATSQKSGSITLRPVTSGSEENKAFYASTPSGEVKFSTVNKAALDALPLGAEVYIDITIAEPATV